MNLKAGLKNALERSGWFLRRTGGLQIGVNLANDLRALFLNPPTSILDIGAHVGESAAQYSSIFPGARIYAFEPVNNNFCNLIRNTSHLSNFECINQAVGRSAGELEIVIDAGNSQAHSFVKSGSANATVERVKVTSIDAFLGERRVQPELIKIDVEGFELEVLAGSAKTLALGCVKALLIEATISARDGGAHTQLGDLCAHLEPKGFFLSGIYDQHVYGNPRELKFFNALFVSQ